MKLAAKLTILLALISLLPLLIAGYSSFNQGKQGIEAIIIERLNSITTLKEQGFDHWLETNRQSLLLLAQRPLVRVYTAELTALDASEDPSGYPHYSDLLSDHLIPKLNREGGFIELFILRVADGTVLISTDVAQVGKSYQDEVYFSEGQRGTYIQNAYYSSSRGKPLMTIVTPITDKQGNLIAVLGGHVNLDEMTQIMTQRSSPEATEETYLVNTSNFFVTEPHFEPGFSLKQTVHTDGVTACLQRQSGVDTYENYQGILVIGVYHWLPETELCILTEVDQARALTPVILLRNANLIVGLVVVALVVLIGVFGTRSLTRPIAQLVVGAQEIAQGNLGYRIQLQSRDEFGELAAAFNNMVMARQQVEKDLRQSEEKFRNLADEITDGVAITVAGKNYWVNQAFAQIFGYTPAEMLGHGPELVIVPEELPALYERAQKRASGTYVPPYFEQTAIRKDGHRIYIELASKAISFDDLAAVQLVVHDVTERRQVEEELRLHRDKLELLVAQRTQELAESEARYRILAEAAPDMIFVVDREDNVQYVNNLLAGQMDKRPEELLGQPRLQAMRPLATEKQSALLAQVFDVAVLAESQDFVSFLYTDIWLSTRLVPIKNASGAVTAVLGVAHDITELKRSGDALQASEERLSLVIEASNTGIWDWDIRTNEVYYSPRWKSLIGFADQELENRFDEWENRLHPDDKPRTLAALDAYLQHPEGNYTQEFRMLHKDGSYRWILNRSAALIDASGKPYRMYGSHLDITSRKEAEQALQRRSEDLARSNRELEQFAYVASHDLQEPLRMVTSYLQLLSRRYRGKIDEDADDFIAYAVDGAKRMHILINDLLTYSRVGTRGKELIPVDSAVVLEQTLMALQVRIEEHEAIITTDPLPFVLADDVQLQQLFQNLIGNAIKFCGEASPRIYLSVQRQEDRWLFSVQDNGIGLDPKYAERIFVIFQRLHSREEFEGTGIGLAICKKIVERHGGTIWVESELGKGATFHFTLLAVGDKLSQ